MKKTDNGLGGWLKLHRSILNSTVFADEKSLKFFIWCIIKAAREPCDVQLGNQVIHLERGQFITGRKQAAEELGMGEQTIRNQIANQQKQGRITSKSTNKFTLISVVNFEIYQGGKPARQPATQPTKNQQPNQQKNHIQEIYINTKHKKDTVTCISQEKREGADALSPSGVPEGWDDGGWNDP